MSYSFQMLFERLKIRNEGIYRKWENNVIKYTAKVRPGVLEVAGKGGEKVRYFKKFKCSRKEINKIKTGPESNKLNTRCQWYQDKFTQKKKNPEIQRKLTDFLDVQLAS